MESPEIKKPNPFEDIRVLVGQDRSTYAAALGVPYSSIYRLEKGQYETPPDEVLKALSDLGYDTDELKRRYAEWREIEMDSLRSAIREKSAV